MKKNRWLRAALMAVLAAALSLAEKPASQAKITYQYSRHGNPDIFVSPTPLVVLSGGGTDVAEAFQRMCVANNGGDFLVLGTATFNKNYYSYIRNSCIDAGKPANSVAVLIVPDAAAADQPFVYDTILQAETIWIAGGDQSDYINFWGGNRKVQQALNARIWQRVVIGGISAGMNVLTEFVYTAQGTTTVTSSFALANPNSPSITIGSNFVILGALQGLIGDPHFVTRDRMGRDLAFLYRIHIQSPNTIPRGISVDEGTAVIVTGTSGHWAAEVTGAGNAYFLQPVQLPSYLGTLPLTGISVQVFRVGPGGTFSISASTWTGSAYRVWADMGVLKSDQTGYGIY